jgi:uncharacterized membrane protein YkoI
MKQILLICAVLLLSGWLQAQKLKESEVPVIVKGAFMKNFPNAKDVKWSKESESEFEAEFRNGSRIQAANFDSTGKLLITETEIKKTDLPVAVLTTIKKEFDGYKLEEIEKAEIHGSMFYELELEKGEKSYTIQISPDGKVLKREEKKEEKA